MALAHDLPTAPSPLHLTDALRANDRYRIMAIEYIVSDQFGTCTCWSL
jgi:hypothetical protein